MSQVLGKKEPTMPAAHEYLKPKIAIRKSNVIVTEGKPQPMTDMLKGRTIERVLRTSNQLLIRCADGFEVRVSWRDDLGRMVGTPIVDEVRQWK